LVAKFLDSFRSVFLFFITPTNRIFFSYALEIVGGWRGTDSVRRELSYLMGKSIKRGRCREGPTSLLAAAKFHLPPTT
jgi:hypothetical protein